MPGGRASSTSLLRATARPGGSAAASAPRTSRCGAPSCVESADRTLAACRSPPWNRNPGRCHPDRSTSRLTPAEFVRNVEDVLQREREAVIERHSEADHHGQCREATRRAALGLRGRVAGPLPSPSRIPLTLPSVIVAGRVRMAEPAGLRTCALAVAHATSEEQPGFRDLVNRRQRSAI